eukprot:2344754-Rhodomonas_salina.1
MPAADPTGSEHRDGRDAVRPIGFWSRLPESHNPRIALQPCSRFRQHYPAFGSSLAMARSLERLAAVGDPRPTQSVCSTPLAVRLQLRMQPLPPSEPPSSSCSQAYPAPSQPWLRPACSSPLAPELRRRHLSLSSAETRTLLAAAASPTPYPPPAPSTPALSPPLCAMLSPVVPMQLSSLSPAPHAPTPTPLLSLDAPRLLCSALLLGCGRRPSLVPAAASDSPLSLARHPALPP